MAVFESRAVTSINPCDTQSPRGEEGSTSKRRASQPGVHTRHAGCPGLRPTGVGELRGSVCVRADMCVSVSGCERVYICVCVCLCMCVYVHIFMCRCVCWCLYVCACVCVHASTLDQELQIPTPSGAGRVVKMEQARWKRTLVLRI